MAIKSTYLLKQWSVLLAKFYQKCIQIGHKFSSKWGNIQHEAYEHFPSLVSLMCSYVRYIIILFQLVSSWNHQQWPCINFIRHFRDANIRFRFRFRVSWKLFNWYWTFILIYKKDLKKFPSLNIDRTTKRKQIQNTAKEDHPKRIVIDIANVPTFVSESVSQGGTQSHRELLTTCGCSIKNRLEKQNKFKRWRKNANFWYATIKK